MIEYDAKIQIETINTHNTSICRTQTTKTTCTQRKVGDPRTTRDGKEKKPNWNSIQNNKMKKIVSHTNSQTEK